MSYARVRALCFAAGIFTFFVVSSPHARAQFPIYRAGLSTSNYTGSGGYQYSELFNGGTTGTIAGTSLRFAVDGSPLGTDVWTFNRTLKTNVQLGLFGTNYAGPNNLQNSGIYGVGNGGIVTGYSLRYGIDGSDLGISSWIYNPAIANATFQIGLTGNAYIINNDYFLPPGYYSDVSRAWSTSGFVAGETLAASLDPDIYPVSQHAWIYNPTTGQSSQIGLTGSGFELAGFRRSWVDGMNPSGQTIGWSWAITPTGGVVGGATWFYDPSPSSGQTIRTGLTSGEFVSAEGVTSSTNVAMNNAGFVIGYNISVDGNSAFQAWQFNRITGQTTAIGLSGGVYGSQATGYESRPLLMNESSDVAGYSSRTFDGSGQDAWVYRPSSNTTTFAGLTGWPYTHPSGAQNNVPELLARNAPVLAGYSYRYYDLGSSEAHGRNTWTFDPTSGTTYVTGFTGSSYTRQDGFQFSQNVVQNNVGDTAGTSNLYFGTMTQQGKAAWYYSTQSHLVTQIGLQLPEYLGSSSYQRTDIAFISDIQPGLAPIVAGTSQRVLGTNTPNGKDAWVYFPITNVTVQIGLTTSAHSGSNFYQNSSITAMNSSGVLAGWTGRITGLQDNNGQDAWLYFPSTHTTHKLTEGVTDASLQITGYSFSTITLLTENNKALGTYKYFPGGTGVGQDHLFVYSVEGGFVDLGENVDGGLSANGWSKLSSVLQTDGYSYIAGLGSTFGQPAGSQSIYVLTPIPEPGSMLGLGAMGLLAIRYRRRRSIATPALTV